MSASACGMTTLCARSFADDGVLAGCRPGTVIAIHSTVHPDVDLPRQRPPNEPELVDAPVSGGRDVALSGELVVAVGGDAKRFSAAEPYSRRSATR